jgi:hypothetical protein
LMRGEHSERGGRRRYDLSLPPPDGRGGLVVQMLLLLDPSQQLQSPTTDEPTGLISLVETPAPAPPPLLSRWRRGSLGSCLGRNAVLQQH